MQVLPDGVSIPVTYCRSWNDGFGARGWKLDIAIGDPEIIASTRETGQRIHTSVFVHDILDHFLSGFDVSGHRSEAMALIQLSKRTCSDPGPDYRQMVREDIMNGRVNGESLTSFLPERLEKLLPPRKKLSDKEIIAYLRQEMGEAKLEDALVEHFYTLGKTGEGHALRSWEALGLDPEKRTEIALALQRLLEVVDTAAEDTGAEMIKGYIVIEGEYVKFKRAK